MKAKNNTVQNVLAIDTSSKACVLGIADLTKDKIENATQIVGRTHSTVILPNIVSLLDKCNLELADLDLIVYGKGPGSFTGLRIGVGVVQGLAYGLDIPVVGVSSLACLAQETFRCEDKTHCVVALTARLQEVYYGVYAEQDGYMTLSGKEGVCEAREMPKQDSSKAWVGVGNAWSLKSEIEMGIKTEITHVFEREHTNVIDLLALGINEYRNGRFGDAFTAQPEYLKETVANLPNSGK